MRQGNVLHVEPVTLQGKMIRLAPLSMDHVPQLAVAGKDPVIWKYMRYGLIDSEEKMRGLVTYMFHQQERGTDLPFAVLLADSGRPIGMTRYMNIEPTNLALEIGGTWYATAYQHTGVNTEAKFLLLQHAFESLGCIRVQFKADVRNERSLRAIERIGAVKEGVLRNNMVLPDGTVRSSVYYSILDSEWPEVKQHMFRLMDR